VEASFALMPKYDAFFNFNVGKGYSGTVIYTRRTTCVPTRAEEGITGRLVEDKDNVDEAIGGYPTEMAYSLSSSDYNKIDDEGRCVVVDLEMFVLFNLYCPNETSPERLPYKMNYYYSLEERVQNLINQGREIMIVGDMNICRDRIDHCDPEQSCRDHSLNTFQDHPARRWFDNFLAPKGPLTDMGRKFHPDRKGMYTHWDMKIDGRGTNYGTRLDYILVTDNLVNWIKDCDIQNQIYGSDHCPVYADLHDVLVCPKTGEKKYLNKLLRSGRPWDQDHHEPVPPKMAARFFEEFSNKQRKIATFFSKSSAKVANENPTVEDAFGVLREGSTNGDISTETLTQETPFVQSKQAEDSIGETPSKPANVTKDVKKLASPSVPRSRTPSATKVVTSGKDPKNQRSLKTFFGGSKEEATGRLSSQDGQFGNDDKGSEEPQRMSYSDLISNAESEVDPQNFTWSDITPETTAAWDAIFTRKQPPLCQFHQEAAKQWTVNKSGPNHGRKFWLCHRPVGPGYDNGERPRSEVNREYRCDYFIWDSQVPKGNGGANPNVSLATNSSQDKTSPPYKRMKTVAK